MNHQPQKETVRKMFDDISPKYDFLNHFLSFGIDKGWRKTLVSILARKNPKSVLDVATGTADLAIAMAELKPQKIVGIDLSEKMLAIGNRKIEDADLARMITLKRADAEKLPFSDHSFEAVTVAFGVRNFENLTTGLAEMKRVLRPGGTLLILEFSKPASLPVRLFYGLYSKVFIPSAGRLISKNTEAYRYLPESVAAFPSGKAFLDILAGSGLKNVSMVSLSFGIATIYIAEK
jgi:demethylmenaquinone methyltransferase/2-methoxy-6-polyprenyl-1,4-benzoquinol methylase